MTFETGQKISYTEQVRNPHIHAAERLLVPALQGRIGAEIDAHVAVEQALRGFVAPEDDDYEANFQDPEFGKLHALRGKLYLQRYRASECTSKADLNRAGHSFEIARTALENTGLYEDYIRMAPEAAVALRLYDGNASQTTKIALTTAKRARDYAAEAQDAPELTKIAKRADTLAHSLLTTMPPFRRIAVNMAFAHEYPKHER